MSHEEVPLQQQQQQRGEKNYTLRYEGNNSKRWDGKTIVLDGAYLESVVEGDELVPGKVIQLPWNKKGGGTEYWKAVIEDTSMPGKCYVYICFAVTRLILVLL